MGEMDDRLDAAVRVLVQRIGDEKAAAILGAMHALIREARNGTLEQAARMLEGPYTTGTTRGALDAFAAAIRALKDEERQA